MANFKPTFLMLTAMVGISASLLPASQVAACDMHEGMGFGFGVHSSARQFSPMSAAQQTPKIKLDYPFMTRVSSEQSTDIEIGYQRPFDITNATIRIEPSEALTLKSETQLDLSDEKGSHKVKIEAQGPGQHVLLLNVEGLYDNKPISMVRRIYINSRVAN